ncbi:MAG: AzlC family ABC transporter permease [Gudongella sp.]|nr:AzlC family ABC transporter permease [Gudongella sp.]
MSVFKNKSIKEGIVYGSPLVLGYLPVAMAFGLLAKNTGLSFFGTSASSIFVFAGSSQFMFLDLIRVGVSPGSIILATFLLNLRHLIMSASLSTKLDDNMKPFVPIIGFGITDETFSVLSFYKEKLSLPFILTVNGMAYLAWVGGTIFGYLVGEIIPQALQTSLGLGLYALFAALLFPSFKTNKSSIFVSLIAVAVYTIIYYSNILSSGWDIIAGIIISTWIATIILERKELRNE